MRKYLTLILVLNFFSLVVSCSKTSDFEIIRNRVISNTYFAVDDKSVEDIMDDIKEDGSWPDINYEDTSSTGFRHEAHLNRMVELANAYRSEESPYKNDKKVLSAFNDAARFWLKYDFQCENWWNNQIGTPTAFIKMLLIMDDSLDDSLTGGMVEIAGRANLEAWGARPSGDRIKMAGLQAKTALYSRDVASFKRAMDVIMKEMKISAPDERGIQSDYSFHHREDRVNNTLTYGLDFIDIYAEWAEYTANTTFGFSEESVKLAVDYYLDGVCKQMVYGRLQDAGVRNRDITRIDRGVYASILTPERLLKATDYRRDELINVINARKDKKFTPESFAKFFWQTEHFVFQRPDFYTSVRMYSTRNRNMEEPYNGEGLKNHFRADGSNYLTVRGDEYLNISPVYDWNMIPGTTTLLLDSMPKPSDTQKEGLSEFVGAVTDGMYGAVGFDFVSSHYPLKAKKSWFFFDDKYVCLGTDIQSVSDRKIVTTISQSYLSGKVSFSENGAQCKLGKSDKIKSLKDARWIKHGDIGFVILDESLVGLYAGKAEGSWFSVNCQTCMPKNTIIKDVFKLWIDHGKKQKNASYAYMVFPKITDERLEKETEKTSVRVLSNTEVLQAVDNRDDGILYMVVYGDGVELQHDLLGNIRLDSSGLLMVKYSENGSVKEIAYSDPTRELKEVNISIQGQQDVASDATIHTYYDNEKGMTDIRISLPVNEFKGKTKVVSFR